MSALTRLTLKYCNLDDFVVNKAPHLSLILLAWTSEFPPNVLANRISTNSCCHKVLMEGDNNILLIIGNPQGI
jgi:hypothetical protein